MSIVGYIYFRIITSTTIGNSDLGKILVCIQPVMVVVFAVLFLIFFGPKVEMLHRDDG